MVFYDTSKEWFVRVEHCPYRAVHFSSDFSSGYWGHDDGEITIYCNKTGKIEEIYFNQQCRNCVQRMDLMT